MEKRVFAAMMAAMMLALTGCGGAVNTAPAGGDNKVTAQTDAGSDAGVARSDNSEKKWIITSDTVFKPFEYTDDAGNFVGIDVDILAAVAEDQGFDYELQSLGWDAAIAACQAGQADGMIAGASITEERKRSGWIFSEGYYDANQSMAVKGDSDITGFDGITGKTIAVKTGTMSASYADELTKDYDFKITYYEDSPAMYQAIVDGQADACFDDTPIMASTIKDSGIDMKIVDGTGNEPNSYGFVVFNPDNQELVDMFNKGLENIKANGKYQEILDKYLGN